MATWNWEGATITHKIENGPGWTFDHLKADQNDPKNKYVSKGLELPNSSRNAIKKF